MERVISPRFCNRPHFSGPSTCVPAVLADPLCADLASRHVDAPPARGRHLASGPRNRETVISRVFFRVL
jgi:hypothetical protein